jgi:hypothetical protein
LAWLMGRVHPYVVDKSACSLLCTQELETLAFSLWVVPTSMLWEEVGLHPDDTGERVALLPTYVTPGQLRSTPSWCYSGLGHCRRPAPDSSGC